MAEIDVGTVQGQIIVTDPDVQAVLDAILAQGGSSSDNVQSTGGSMGGTGGGGGATTTTSVGLTPHGHTGAGDGGTDVRPNIIYVPRININTKWLGVGTVFSTNPAPVNGDLYFRTDLGWLCFYDGTRWLTVHEYSTIFELSFIGTQYNPNNASPRVALRTDYLAYVTRLLLNANVPTLNNGANYWVATIRGVNAALNASTNLGSVNTSTWTAGVKTRQEGNINVAVAASNHAFLDVYYTQVGSPGATLDGTQSAAYYRLIIT